jgi:hypothetical protein
MIINNKPIVLVLLMAMLLSCSKKTLNPQEDVKDKSTEMSFSGPPTIVYKTRADYFDKVPVTLSADGKSIASYPGTKDVYYKGALAYPARLNDGYLLDNRGINEHVAFLDYTYEEYAGLAATPTADELLKHLLSADPLTEMYHCGSRFQYKNIEEDLNRIISEKQLGTCKRLK